MMFGTARLQLLAIGIIVLFFTHMGAYLAGWYKGVASEKQAWMLERAQIVAQAEARAATLRERGDRLAADLELARANVRVEFVERVRVVYRTASVTKQCFSPDVTALLNQHTPIRETVHRVGEPAKEIVHQPPGGTSEQAAAEWILHAQAEHNACRAQVARLVDWIRSATGAAK